MKADVPKFLNQYRCHIGAHASPDSFKCTGLFIGVPVGNGALLRILSSEGCEESGSQWDHVSVSLADRCPTWDEMCHVKALFFRDDEWVVQLHPPAKENINHHPLCLHLWRPTDQEIPKPPRNYV